MRTWKKNNTQRKKKQGGKNIKARVSNDNEKEQSKDKTKYKTKQSKKKQRKSIVVNPTRTNQTGKKQITMEQSMEYQSLWDKFSLSEML